MRHMRQNQYIIYHGVHCWGGQIATEKPRLTYLQNILTNSWSPLLADIRLKKMSSWSQLKRQVKLRYWHVFRNFISCLCSTSLRLCISMVYVMVCCNMGPCHKRTWFPSQYKESLSRYEDFHYKDETVVRPSHLYNGNHHIDKTVSLFWDILHYLWILWGLTVLLWRICCMIPIYKYCNQSYIFM